MKDIIPVEEQKQIEAKNNDVLAQANALVIKTEADTHVATRILKVIKEIRTGIEDKFSPPVKSAKKAYEDARDLRDGFLKPLKDCEANLRSKIGDFVYAEQERRDALQAKEDAKFQKAADKAAETGKPLTAAPVIINKVSGAAGTSFSTTWFAEVTDIKAVCKAIVDGTLDPICVEANMPFFNKMATAYKREGQIAPGVVAKKKITTRV